VKKRYQTEYASGRDQMYDVTSRIEKAKHIVKTLEDYYGKMTLKKLTVLDVGASTGIIDQYLAKHFKKVVGTDIDKGAIQYAKKTFKAKNLVFKYEDAMKLSFKKETFDVVICTHVYEHVPNAQKLFNEMYRVLKSNGVCYLAAINALWPIEPHYDLPFLSYLPKKYANYYIRIKGKHEYYETPVTYWGLMKLTHKFEQIDYTKKILSNAQQFGYKNKILDIVPTFIFRLLAPLAKYFAPTTFWILKKA
jgi:2-polyprenyl-3-methyl-5-hydroxy-6-metoxy-1,4-benzoquinol methylase